MRYALQKKRVELCNVLEDFSASSSGPLGAWRLMSVLRRDNPAEVLASVPPVLPQLSVPALIFRGSDDLALQESFAIRAGALIPQSRLVTVDAGHFFRLNDPDLVTIELKRFFEGTGDV